MLQYLPYVLAAYGGYKGYQANKNSSGLNRILGAATGATLGYYGGKMVPGVREAGFANAASANYVPAFRDTGIAKILGLGTPQAVTSATGDAAIAEKIAMQNAGAGGGADSRSLLQKLFYKKDTPSELDPLKLFATTTGLTYASGAFNQGPVDVYQPTYNIGYDQLAQNRPGFKYIDPATGQEKEYEKVWYPEGNVEGNPYQMVKYTLAKGGLAEIKKFNEGGINYLPSKITHDEDDANNYVRARGYVEDGSGHGDKDEDTMLAQLADGEFVTRADGVLGAGLIAGANPKSIKDMREKGAKFFYEQQKRYKRIFDLIQDAYEQNGKAN